MAARPSTSGGASPVNPWGLALTAAGIFLLLGILRGLKLPGFPLLPELADRPLADDPAAKTTDGGGSSGGGGGQPSITIPGLGELGPGTPGIGSGARPGIGSGGGPIIEIPALPAAYHPTYQPVVLGQPAGAHPMAVFN